MKAISTLLFVAAALAAQSCMPDMPKPKINGTISPPLRIMSIRSTLKPAL